MARVVIYTTSYCPYCFRAKALFSSKHIAAAVRYINCVTIAVIIQRDGIVPLIQIAGPEIAVFVGFAQQEIAPVLKAH